MSTRPRTRLLRLKSALALRLLAGLLSLLALPGVEELTEDLVHYALDGHTAHDEGHEDEQPGHCCSGLFHTCSCCPHAPAIPGGLAWSRPARVSRGAEGARYGLGRTALLGAVGYRAPPFRPPTA